MHWKFDIKVIFRNDTVIIEIIKLSFRDTLKTLPGEMIYL